MSTNWFPIAAQVWEMDVQYDPETPTSKVGYSKNKPKMTASYVFNNLFSAKENVEKFGYSICDDGSTTNLSAHFKHVRENVVAKIWTYFWFYFVLSTIMGAVIFFSSAHVMNSIIDPRPDMGGHTYNGTWEIGCASFMIIMWVHIFIWIIEVRSYNLYLWLALFISIICYFPG